MAGPAEWVRLNGQLVAVPSVVCERRPAFDAALSQAAWDTLADTQRDHLRTLLPSFPGDDSGREQEETVRRLFAGENFRFGNPLDHFFRQLHDGQLTDQIHSLRRLAAETQRQDAKVWRQNYMDGLLQELVKKRKQLLDAAVKTPPDGVISLPPAKKKCRRSLLEQRARKRYFRELDLARAEAGCAADEHSMDENYPEGPPAALSRKQQRHLAKLEATLSGGGGMHVPVAATDSRLPTRGPHLTEHASPEDNPYQVAEARISQLLRRHGRRRARGQVTASTSRDRPRLDLQSLLKRSPPGGHSTDSDSDTAVSAATPIAAATTSRASPAPRLIPAARPKAAVAARTTPAAARPAPAPPPPSASAATATATVSGSGVACWQAAALGQKTHASFFSLLRDVLCSDPGDRLPAGSVHRAIAAWQQSPIAALNDWYGRAASWVAALPSALAFLSGEVGDVQSQINMVPFLDHVRDSGIYQWIGAGRDSDIHLESLCAYWLQRKDLIIVKREPMEEGGGDAHSTSSTARTSQLPPSTSAERDEYRKQERQRYQTPRRAFTFRVQGRRWTVGPVRAGRDSKAGRGHALLSADRPAGATLLSLVRDAVARLPGGEGSRADVCELVKDSGYVVAGSDDQLVSAAVSSALDRLQAELDPCAKYDAHRKIWVCLHRHRTEAELEAMERQRQANSPRRRQAVKRSLPTAVVATTSAGLSVPAAAVASVAVAAPAGASLLKPRTALTLAAAQPRLSAPVPAPAAVAVTSALGPQPPLDALTQTELAVQSILPAAPPTASPAPVRTPANVSVPIAAPTVVPAAAAPVAVAAAAGATRLQLVSRASVLSPGTAVSSAQLVSAAHGAPTVQSVKVVKNQHAIVHIPSKTPGAAPQLALLANGKLIPIVNQPATVKTADGRPRASVVVAPQRPTAAARGRPAVAAAAPARVPAAVAAVSVQETSALRPLMSRPAAAVAATATVAPAAPQLIQVSGSAVSAAASAAAAPVVSAVSAVSVASVVGGVHGSVQHGTSGTTGLKHITIPVSQLSRLLQQQAAASGGGAGAGVSGALTLAQIGGRQVLIAARPAAKAPVASAPGLQLHRVPAGTHAHAHPAPTQTVRAVHTVQTVHGVQTVQPQQVLLQGAVHVASSASSVSQARQLTVATSQLQLTSGVPTVAGVRAVAAGRPVVLSSAAQSPVLLSAAGGLRGLHGYKLVQLPAHAAAGATSVQARGVPVVATAVQQKVVPRPADRLVPLVAATSSAAAATVTPAPPAVTQS